MNNKPWRLARTVCVAAALLTLRCMAAANPTPYIDILSPTAITPGSPDTVLTIGGAGFAPGARVKFNTLLLTPASIAPGKITVTLPASQLSSPGSAAVTVINTDSHVPVSNGMYLRIRNSSGSAFVAAKPGIPVSGVSSLYFPQYVVGDFNNDGHMDVISFGPYPTPVSAYLGDGTGKFSSGLALPNVGVPAQRLVADLDGDGNLDLVIPNGTNSVLLGDGHGHFSVKQTLCPSAGSSCLQPFAIADFTGDGVPDLIGIVSDYSLHTSSLAVLPGLGDGSFVALPIEESMPFPGTVWAIGEFTGDGVLDVLASSQNTGSLLLFRGLGNGQFNPIQTPLSHGFGGSFLAGDFNGDGQLDFVGQVANFGDTGSVVALNAGSGNFTAQPSPVDFSFKALRYADDLNGDGKLDLLADDGFYLGDGLGHFAQVPLFSQTNEIVNPAAADFNGDGRVDMIALKQFFVDSSGGADFESNLFLQVPETRAELAGTIGFGSYPVGTWLTKYVPIQNTGNSTLYLSDFLLTPDSQTGPSDFHPQLNTCASAVPPGETCTLHLTYHPAGLESAQAKLSVLGNVAGGALETQLLGTGQQFVNFKDVTLGSFTSLDLPLTSTDPTSVTVISAATVTTFPGTPSEDFRLDGYGCQAVSSEWAALSPWPNNEFGLCDFFVSFKPSRAGYEFAKLHVYTTAPRPGWRILYLFGKGVKQ